MGPQPCFLAAMSGLQISLDEESELLPFKKIFLDISMDLPNYSDVELEALVRAPFPSDSPEESEQPDNEANLMFNINMHLYLNRGEYKDNFNSTSQELIDLWEKNTEASIAPSLANSLRPLFKEAVLTRIPSLSDVMN